MALQKASFDVARGSITSLIGPNGAGKTTLFNVITGFVSCQTGLITFQGLDITSQLTHQRCALGLVRTFQNLEIFSNMTALQNVMTGCHTITNYTLWDSLIRTKNYQEKESLCRDRALYLLNFVGLGGVCDTMAGALPFGQQRLLEIARALAGKPSLLLLDEPAAGLNMRETKELGLLIKRIRNELNISVALVEHDMELVMLVSDAITVLSFGQVLAAGSPMEIQKNPAVVAAYLGIDEAE